MIDPCTGPKSVLGGVAILMLSVAAACSSSSSPTTIYKYVDGGGEGGASGTYPAFVPDVGQLADHGGPKLTSAKIVTVTFPGDSNVSTWEDFDDKLGASDYWKSTLTEYGIGAATSGGHVHVTTPPKTAIDVADLESWLVTQVMSPSTSGFPAYDAQTLYVVWIPASVMLTSGGQDACMGNQGTYHSEVAVGSNNVPYVFVDEACNGSQSLVDVATQTGGHAIAEAVTDPNLYTKPAYVGFDASHIAFQAWQGNTAEVADVCDLFSDAFFKGPASLPYSIQHLWSNASAKGGHDPCTPVGTAPYYNVAPQGLEMLTTVVVGTSSKALKGLGYDVPVGSTKAIQVGYFSDAAMSGPITLTAVEGDGFNPPAYKGVLSFSIATGQGSNGDTDTVSVTTHGGNAPGNAFLMTLVTSAPGLPKHYMPVLIQTL